METIEMLIEDLHSAIMTAKKAPLSSTDILLNKNAMQDLVAKFRKAYPTCLKEANDVLKKQDEIIKAAEDHANSVMDKAEEYARSIIEETEVVKKANEYADEIKKQAINDANRTDYEAKVSAYSLLEDVEKTLAKTLDTINLNKQKLIK